VRDKRTGDLSPGQKAAVEPTYLLTVIRRGQDDIAGGPSRGGEVCIWGETWWDDLNEW
jgi:hypothetical protein